MTFEQMWADLAPLGRSARSGGYFRQPFTPVEEELQAWYVEQAERRGMRVEVDGFGNRVAWWGDPGRDGGEAVLTGSHLDSVLDGGAFDGPLGVVSAFAAIDLLRERGVEPARAVGVASFREEEGSRFPVACLGSRLATGSMAWDEARILRDRDGVALADVVEGGPTTEGWLDKVGVFLELHVEQGRDLVHRDRPVALAQGIWPHGRYRFDVTGRADHAGATRMPDRHDPMLTYARTVLAANKHARLEDQRATFGRVEVHPGSTNAVPGRVTGWLDVRADSAEALEQLVATIGRLAAEHAERDGTEVEVTAESVSDAVTFDAALARRLGAAGDLPVIATAAGHDAGVLSAAGIPTAMLFVRNPTGVSHSPEENASIADCLHGVEALADSLALLAGGAR